MIRVLAAGVLAMVVSLIIGPRFIAFLRKNEFGQHIREEGPQAHGAKQGTPTMGGLLILVVAAAAFLSMSKYKVPALTVLFVTLGCGAVGFLDDFIKLRHRRSLGLRGRWKMLLLGLITVGVVFAARHQQLPTNVFIPVVHWNVELSYGWYVLVFLVIAGTANGVNLTDGIDGLAAGAGIIALVTYTAISVVVYIRSSVPGSRLVSRLDLAIVGAALIGPVAVHRRDLRDRGAVGDRAGDLVQVLGTASLPDGTDPPSLRDEGLVRDQDHGALLDRHGDPLRDRLRPVLPRLHVLPPLSALGMRSCRSTRRFRRPRGLSPRVLTAAPQAAP